MPKGRAYTLDFWRGFAKVHMASIKYQPLGVF